MTLAILCASPTVWVPRSSIVPSSLKLSEAGTVLSVEVLITYLTPLVSLRGLIIHCANAILLGLKTGLTPRSVVVSVGSTFGLPILPTLLTRSAGLSSLLLANGSSASSISTGDVNLVPPKAAISKSADKANLTFLLTVKVSTVRSLVFSSSSTFSPATLRIESSILVSSPEIALILWLPTNRSPLAFRPE